MTALLSLGVLAAVIGWRKRLPQAGERFGDISVKRRLLTVMLFPVCIAVIAVATGLVWAGVRSGERGYPADLQFAWLGLTICGFGYLLVLGTVRLVRPGEPRPTGEDTTQPGQVPSEGDGAHKTAAPVSHWGGDGGLEAFVEQQSAEALHRNRWFVRQRLVVRLLLVLSFAALMTGMAAAICYGLAKYQDEPIGLNFWLPLMAVALISLAIMIPAAVSPVRYTRAVIRSGAMFPTSSPGQGIWQGRDRSTRDRPQQK